MKFLRTMTVYTYRKEISFHNLNNLASIESSLTNKTKQLRNSFYWNNSAGENSSFDFRDVEKIVYETNDISLFKSLKAVFPHNNVKVRFRFF